ncbi:MAG: glucoamylase family protein, partial [Betaproteobacteria bacterium]
APWAVVASLPFAPEIVIPTLDYFEALRLRANNPYGFKATYNATFTRSGDPSHSWISPFHYGLNQGPIVLMIENYRSGLVWNLMRACPYLVAGLSRAGFQGGWLEPT